MNDPTTWHRDPHDVPPEPLGELLDAGRRLTPFTPASAARAWRGGEAGVRGSQPDRPAWLWPARATAIVAVVAGVTLVLRPPAASGARQIQLAGAAELELSAAAVVDVPQPATPSPAGYVMTLASGRVCAHVAHRDLPREGPFIVAAPRLTVTVVGTRFCVDASAEVTTVEVTEGKVRVEAAGARGARGAGRAPAIAAFVAAGESYRSDATPPLAQLPALAAATPEVEVARPSPKPSAAHPVAGCPAELPAAARADCYAGMAAGDDLAAQNALFALALLTRTELHDGPGSLSHLHTYLARFPQGALAPEAREAVIVELAGEQRRAEALVEAESYLRSYGWEGRAPEVALLRARLLRDAPSGEERRSAEALALYRDLLGRAVPAAVREEALFGAAVTALELGERTAGREDLARYQREFPAGDHRAEVEGLLGQ